MVVPPHCFCTGSEASLVFHLQTTSKFIFEIRVSFPLEFKQFFFFFFFFWPSVMEEAPGFLECILKNCWCFNTSLTFKWFNFLYHCFLAASLESEGGVWGLRAAGVSEMMKCLKKAVFFFPLSLLMNYWEIFVSMNARKKRSREGERERRREGRRKEEGKGGREKERMKGNKFSTCTS